MSFKQQIYCIILAGHGTALGSMALYIRKLQSMECLWVGIDPLLEALHKRTHSDRPLTVVLDHPAYQTRIHEILQFCKKDFTLVVMTRDPVDQLISIANTHLYYWALASMGLYTDSPLEKTLFYEAGSIAELFNKCLYLDVVWPVAPLLPILAKHAGKIIITDVEDLSPENDMDTVRRIAKAIYGSSDACVLNSPGGRMRSLGNRFMGKIKKLKNREQLPFTLELLPEKFCAYWGYDLSDALCNEQNLSLSGSIGKDLSASLYYDAKEVGFNFGEFDGRLAFVFDPQEIIASGLPKDKFIQIAKTIVEKNNKEILSTYCKQTSSRLGAAQDIFDSLRLNTNKLTTIINADPEIYTILSQQIHNLAKAMLPYGINPAKKWQTSGILLLQHGETLDTFTQQQVVTLQTQVDELRQALLQARKALAGRH